MAKRIAKNVMLIGWSSAEWNILSRLAEEGELPNFKSLLKLGVHGLTKSSTPTLQPSQWTTLVTGKYPFQHNIASYTDIDELESLAGSNIRVTKAIWNILSDKGMKAHQIGCWASHPAEKINGYSVSDQFLFDENNDSVAPADKLSEFNSLKVKTEDVTDEDLAYFIHDIKKVDVNDIDVKKALEPIKKFIADTLSITAVSKHILEQDKEWDFCGVFFNELYLLQKQFMMAHIEASDDLKDVVKGAYKFLDKQLGELLNYCDEETDVILISECGFLEDKNWCEFQNRKNEALEVYTNGTYLRKTSRVASLQTIYDINPTDIVPTILLALGLPLAKDIPGKALVFRKLNNIEEEAIESYETEEHQIVQYGLNKEAQKRIKTYGFTPSTTTSKYLKAQLQTSVNNLNAAISNYIELTKLEPDNPWYACRLANCYLSLGMKDQLKECIENVLQNSNRELVEVRILKANILAAEMKFRSADQSLNIASSKVGKRRDLHRIIAECYLQMKKIPEAQKELKKEINNHPSPGAYYQLATILMNRKRFNVAIEPLESLLELLPQHALGHFHLGTCFMRTSKFEKAVAEFEKVLRLPNVPENILKQANQMRITIYRDYLKDTEKLEELRKAYEDSIGSRGDMIIVSGLPRSGTSMMMQMLVNAGLEAFTDGLREADENNKKGYYEHEAIKALATNNKILHEVGGQVVKIISHLLTNLPHVYNYKIVFMDRPIEEVLTSQHKMLGRLDKAKALQESLALKDTFEKNRNDVRNWAEKSKNVEMIEVPYHEAIADPLKYAQAVKDFLKLENADVNKMAATIDPTLYRERADEINA